ncbi:TetR/AcrR family transcriptional regulator [Polymorphospora sp. NPDC050346]|uniref:TetR/AcrR family transcriptional regulator n=1 Tax=Polymorphospora sp. NPDC050346 TaxID=3155780 RepID=UPI003403DAA8
MATTPTRRERLRTATVTEIKEGARRLLRAGGPPAISLRAIARDMGMTAPAIYRYFPSLDALTAALAGDLYDEVRTTVEAARDAAGADPLAQLLDMARAFRRWAVTHPDEFTLIMGQPAGGTGASEAACADAGHPGARLGATFLRQLTVLWERAPFGAPAGEALERSLAPLRSRHGEVPAEVAYLFLAAWTRLYGLVAMEVLGHLGWAVTDPEPLFEAELASLADQLRSPTKIP